MRLLLVLLVLPQLGLLQSPLRCCDYTGDTRPALAFFVLELFDKVQNALDRAQQPHRWYPESRALLIMLLVMLSVLLFTFPDRPLGMVCVYVAEAVLIAISGYLFMGAQRAINLLSGDTQ